MKKFFSFILFSAFSTISFAQTVSFLVSAVPCHNDGVINASFTGLTPPLTVSWQTYGTSGATIVHAGVSGLGDALTGYSGGELNATVTDALGVVASGFYGGMPPFTICPLTTLSGTCPALDTISASVCSGGMPPFSYQWYNIATTGTAGTADLIFVSPGNYGVTVTDAAGCTFGSKVSGITATAFSTPAFSDSIPATVANCTDGTATIVTYAGGTPPFSYLWSNGATSGSLSGLVMGTYGVTITDALGCQVTSSVTISQSVIVTAPVTTTPAVCAVASGSVSAAGFGGTAPYTYVWSNGATTPSQTGLAGGFYGVNITDANGCIGTDGGLVGTSTPITVTSSATPSLCTTPTGNASLDISGGTGAYSVTWYTTPAQTGVTAHSLIYGTYTFSITDGAGCSIDGSVYVPPIDVISASFSSTPALCTLSNGSLTAYPTGGVAPYFYSWSTGATTQTITAQPAGAYKVTITDHVGCKATKEQALPATSPLGVGITTTPASCVLTNDGVESAVAWGGTPPYSYAWSSGGTAATISALPYGPYWLSVTDAAGCTSTGNYSYVGYDPSATNCYCTISGNVYQDLNSNCVQDPAELSIPGIQVAVSGVGYTYTDGNGNYSVRVPSGPYTVSENTPAFYPISPCQLNDIPVTAVAASGCVHTVNFANSMDSVHDMHISLWDYDAPSPVPGHLYKQVMIVSNDGSLPEDSILVNYHTDAQIFAPLFTQGGIFSGASSQYSSTVNFPALNPGATQQFFMTYNVPANMPAGTSLLFMDTVSYKSPIDFWQIDNTPSNNINSLTTATVNSPGTNFKEVNPKGTGAAGVISYTDSVLEYMVHFQNTGAVTAENIIIIDTLDDNLNWTSLAPVFESAPCKVTLTQNGTKKVAQFTFAEINLPAKANDEMRSNGMLTYTIKLNSELPSGTQIKNHSSVYFDYNAPVITNTTLNTIGAAAPQGITKIHSQNQGAFTIYPNPANRAFNALINSEAATSANLMVYDVTGKAMVSKGIALQKGTQTISVDVSHLASGTYFVSLDENGKTQTQKLVIVN